MKQKMNAGTMIPAALLLVAVCAAQEKVPPPGSVIIKGVDSQMLAPFKPAAEPIAVGGKNLGRVDWGRRVIVAAGRSEQQGEGASAKLSAMNAARLIALRNAVAIGAGVPIGINGKVANLRNGKISFEAHVKDMTVKGYRSRKVGNRTYWIAEVDVPMFGINAFAGTVYNAQLQAHKQLIQGMTRIKWVQPLPAEKVAGDLLVIDARGIKFQPTMFPLVTDDVGQIVFDMQTVTKKEACSRGLCVYGTTKVTFEKLQSAVDLRELDVDLLNLLVVAAAVEKNPASRPSKRKPRRIIFKASKVSGKQKATLVISGKDSRKMVSDPRTAALVRNGKVLVIIDAPAAGMEGFLPGKGLKIAVK